jgi:hypothetical protein
MLEVEPVVPSAPGACIYRSGYARMQMFTLRPDETMADVLPHAAAVYRSKVEHLRACAVVVELGDEHYSAIRLQGDHMDGPLFEVVIPWERDKTGRIRTAPSPLVRPGSWGVFD